MTNKKMPPAIWKEEIEIPINFKKLLPNIAKKISKNKETAKILIESLTILLDGIFIDNEAKIGIKVIGSTATKVLIKFWKKISCIS